jgi:hypothetical protein
MKAPLSFETSEITYQETQRYRSEDFNRYFKVFLISERIMGNVFMGWIMSRSLGVIELGYV